MAERKMLTLFDRIAFNGSRPLPVRSRNMRNELAKSKHRRFWSIRRKLQSNQRKESKGGVHFYIFVPAIDDKVENPNPPKNQVPKFKEFK